MQGYEDVTLYELTPEREKELVEKQIECNFIWTNKDGHGLGVIMNYIARDGSIWLTATSQRARIKALKRDPRASVVISSMGTGTDVSQSITFKGHAVLHKDQETKDWFYPDFARRANSPAPTPEAFVAFLDTPARIIIEVVPEKAITFDGSVMRDTTSEALSS